MRMIFRIITAHLLPSIIDSPEGGAVALGHVLAVIDGLVVVLCHHLLGAVLQVFGFYLHRKTPCQ